MGYFDLFYILLLVHLQFISVAYSLCFGMITLEVDEGDFYRRCDIRCIQKVTIFDCEDVGLDATVIVELNVMM